MKYITIQFFHSFLYFSRLVSILVGRGEVIFAEGLYIDGTIIRSRVSRRRTKWHSSTERFSISANNDILFPVITSIYRK